MVNRHTKRCSTSLTVRKMQIKTTIRYYFTPVKMAIIEKTRNTNVGQDVEKRESLFKASGTVNWWTHCGKHYGDFWKKKKT